MPPQEGQRPSSCWGHETLRVLSLPPLILFIPVQVKGIKFMLTNYEAYQTNVEGAAGVCIWLPPQTRPNKVDIVAKAKVMQ